MLALSLAAVAAASAADAKIDVLKIGTSGTLGPKEGNQEKANLGTLRNFIKDETKFQNEIERQKGWEQLGERLAKGELHVGVFPGHEFAWAQERNPKLKALVVAVNVYPHRYAHIVARKDQSLGSVADLKGKKVAIPDTGHDYLRLFITKEAGAAQVDQFFSKVTTPANYEDTLDDVVDGVVDAAVVDRVALQQFERRKPARFRQLKELAQSPPFPSAVIAYQPGVLDQATLDRFQKGLLDASRNERGRQLISLFRLTGFTTPPSDFDQVLTKMKQDYPGPKSQ
jgi:ABC-type phosphate/phosphonate transport system substrate-binding protein